MRTECCAFVGGVMANRSGVIYFQTGKTTHAENKGSRERRHLKKGVRVAITEQGERHISSKGPVESRPVAITAWTRVLSDQPNFPGFIAVSLITGPSTEDNVHLYWLRVKIPSY